MSENEISCKNEDTKRPTIIRVVHNRENPFVQLNKMALWDGKLSLKATGLWARCMSRPNDWTFSIKELVTKCKEGRRAVDSAMQELIEAGYAIRMEHYEKSENGRFSKGGGIEYIFFEFPATEEEKKEQLEIFKKSFRNCGFGNRRNGNSRNSNLLIKKSTQTEASEEDISPPLPPHSEKKQNANAEKKAITSSSNFSEDVIKIADEMIGVLKSDKPTYKSPRLLSHLHIQIEKMIKEDDRDPNLICKVFRWAIADPFWSPHMFKPNPAKYLREKFDQLEKKMNQKLPEKDRKFAPCSDTQSAIQAMKDKKGAL